jgi:dTDP-glucose pyrophosphorylase
MNKNLLIADTTLIRIAMQLMENNGEKVLFVVDSTQKLLGSITDGDIRRWILSEGNLEEEVKKIYNENPISVNDNYNIEKVKEIMLDKKIEWIPVVDQERKVTDILFWENIFGKEVIIAKEKLNIPVVIMAGGKGNRLDPFTKILPKALIPIKEKPIIEIITERFTQFGVKNFYISVNNKSRMIKAYFEEVNMHHKIQYIEEKSPLGTAGSLKFLEGKINGSFFVTNCDILIESDYSKMYDFHKSNNYDITVVSSYKRYVIPYGVCEIEKGGLLKDLREKPESNLLVNTGMYLVKTDVLKFIPQNTFYLMTDFIKDVKKSGGKVGVYPISEKSWVDIGQWEEYREAIKRLSIEQ